MLVDFIYTHTFKQQVHNFLSKTRSDFAYNRLYLNEFFTNNGSYK